MNKHKFLYLFMAFVVVIAMVAGPGKVTAMPMNPTDESKVPHYFGPYPNWANSPFTLPGPPTRAAIAATETIRFRNLRRSMSVLLVYFLCEHMRSDIRAVDPKIRRQAFYASFRLEDFHSFSSDSTCDRV